ncbi:hypothetical protein GPECTOR_5g254 [Gonium pectorale]|uniref:ApaG domain-containing protein n=1 Tax=Gonium pectorale TaxID=33097 RepID=A0A150GW85_GONPE|nr:hypothetical protein GPECTOR_5g254 [Gonium pectorale]|eukprot:KXZ54156.1 hypothetical protein GPECTOR_5g254 [Gonium pectorale]
MAQLLGPGLRFFPGAETLNAEGLRRVLRANFKSHKNESDVEAPRLLGEALSALRVLLDQLYMHRCSSSCTTDGVRIDATSKFSTAATALNGRTQNLFSYRIRVTNQRQEPIQVLGREWTIQNDRGNVVVQLPHVPGNAIVGQKPIIPPGHAFEYISGTDLDTSAGRQEGKLEIGVLEGNPLKVSRVFMGTVAPFLHMRPDVYRR